VPAATITAASRLNLKKIRIADEKAAARRLSYCILAFKKCAGGVRRTLRHFSLRFGTDFSGPSQ
jgi:hypothetical protein